MLGKLGYRWRKAAGEPSEIFNRLNQSPDIAATASIAAMKAFADGRRASGEKGHLFAIPFYSSAMELDQNFAQAYASLGTVYTNLDRPGDAVPEITRKPLSFATASAKENVSISHRGTTRRLPAN